MRNPFVPFGVVAMSLVWSSTARSQQAATPSESSYTHAGEVLARGVVALGGIQNFQAVEDIRWRATGTIVEVGQSASPDAAYYARPLANDGVMDFAHRRFYQLSRTNYLGSGQRSSSVVTTQTVGFTADIRANAVYPLGAGAVAANNRRMHRVFPYQLLQLALSRAGSLRWLGEVEYGNGKQDIVTSADPDGNLITLYFDRATGLLTKSEGLSDGFIEGLTASETMFLDYRAVNGVLMPFHVVTRVGGAVRSDVSYEEIATNTHPAAGIFDPPNDAVVGPEVGGARQPITLTQLAKDVYFVNAIETGGIFFYSSMFVVFNDFVLVIEAPLSTFVSQAIIAKVKETAPGKPIRYLVPTHYHIDHFGGIRDYIAEGSTIITTPGNRPFIERVAAVVHPLVPDRLSAQPRPPSIETFSQKRVVSDSGHVVELYNVGPTPHVDEMVIAYLPRKRLLFVSDLFLVSFKGRLGPAEPGTFLLDQRIRELGLQVDTIVGGHGRIGTMEELRESLAARSNPTNGQ